MSITKQVTDAEIAQLQATVSDDMADIREQIDTLTDKLIAFRDKYQPLRMGHRAGIVGFLLIALHVGKENF